MCVFVSGSKHKCGWVGDEQVKQRVTPHEHRQNLPAASITVAATTPPATNPQKQTHSPTFCRCTCPPGSPLGVSKAASSLSPRSAANRSSSPS